MKESSRILALTLVLIMIIFTFFGCQTGTSTTSGSTTTSTTGTGTTTTTGEQPWEYMDDITPFEFEVWWASVWGWAKGAVEAGWDDSDVYKFIEKETGVKMLIDMPSGTEEQLAATMIASGSYPDCIVFSSFNSPYIAQMKDAGLIYSWSELIDEYCPKMWSLISESQMLLHSEEGILWKYVGFEYHENWIKEATSMYDTKGYPPYGAHGTNVMFARKDMLSAYGADDITTLEKFTEYLYFVKENYPDVDPLHLFDGDPRGSLFTHFKSTFGCHLSLTYPQEDGTIKYFMYDPAYVDYLKWLNGLYRDGVITANQLADDLSAIDTKFFSANYGAIMSATYVAYNTLETTIKENFGENTDKVYVAIGPIQGEVPWQAMYLRSAGGMATVITKNADNPERIIKFFEFLLTDLGQMTINGGVEGIHWTRNADGTINHNEEKAALAVADLEAYTLKYKVNGNWAPWCNTSYWEGLLGPVLSPPGGRAKQENSIRLASKYVRDIWSEGYADIASSVKVGSDLDVIRTKVNAVCKDAGMQMIAASSDAEFNAIYAKCISDIEALGVDQIEVVYTEEHQRQLKALGIGN